MKIREHIPQLLITVVGGVIVTAIAAKFFSDEGRSSSVITTIEGSNIAASANSSITNSVQANNTNIISQNGSVVINGFNSEVDNHEQPRHSLKPDEVSMRDTEDNAGVGGNSDEIYVAGSNNSIDVVLDSTIEKIKKYRILNSNGNQKLYLSGKYTVRIKNLGANNLYKIPEKVGARLEIKDLGANTAFTSY